MRKSMPHLILCHAFMIVISNPHPSIEVNATFKHAKTVMQTRSWDPESQVAGDVVYWLNGDNYEKLNAGSWSQIKAAKARL